VKPIFFLIRACFSLKTCCRSGFEVATDPVGKVVGKRSWQRGIAKSVAKEELPKVLPNRSCQKLLLGKEEFEKFLDLKVFQKKFLNIQKGWLLEFFLKRSVD
jgi:hypothetical protein